MQSISILCSHHLFFVSSFFFNDTATTEIYTLSLHDALPIFTMGYVVTYEWLHLSYHLPPSSFIGRLGVIRFMRRHQDRKSTRLNSSHSQISYAVFCLKKKKKNKYI